MKGFQIVWILTITLLTLDALAEQPEQDTLSAVLSKFEQDSHHDLHAVVVIRDGKTLAEKYYNGGSNQTLVDVRSAGKSVTSLLFGIAMDQQAIEELTDPVKTYWTDAKDQAVGQVRLEDLLTMRSGLDADANNPKSVGNEDYMDASDDPLSFSLKVPLFEEPGTQYRYNSHAAYVTGIVIAQATGTGLEDFARVNLFEPLGIERLDWQEDRSGITKGQGNLFLTAPGFARIGEMVLNHGTYNGQRIVSTKWIRSSLKPRVDITQTESNAVGYGYYWFHQVYTVKDHPIKVYFASGNGGNKIYLLPDLNIVVAVMSRAYGQGYGHRRSEKILKAVLADQL